MNKPKTIQVDDHNLCALVKKEAKKRGKLYGSFATECLRVGFKTIKESHPSQSNPGDYPRF